MSSLNEKRDALITLMQYNAWRRDNSESPEDRLKQPDPKEIGKAIDLGIESLKMMISAEEAVIDDQEWQ